MQLFQQMGQQGASPNIFTFIQVIKVCAPLRTLEDDRLVYKQLIQTGCESDVFVGSSLVDMYAKCGSIEMLGECSTRCHLEMWSLGAPSYWDM
jgi:hypothetical protein